MGFRKATSTMEGIVALRLLQQISSTSKKSFYLLLSDFEAAYDNIPRIILWKCILSRLPPIFNATVFLMMQSMYRHTESFITNIQETIITENGLIKGNSESCICFNIYRYLQHILNKTRSCIGTLITRARGYYINP